MIPQYDVVGWWFDQSISVMLKLYYWPAFIAGNSDNIQDMFNPRTYSICKI